MTGQVVNEAFEAAVRQLLQHDPHQALQTLDNDCFLSPPGAGAGAAAAVTGTGAPFNLMHRSVAALAHLQLGSLPVAQILLEESLEQLSGLELGKTSDSYLDVGGTLNDAAAVALAMEDFDASIKFTKRALMMARKSYRPDSHLVACLEANHIETLRAQHVHVELPGSSTSSSGSGSGRGSGSGSSSSSGRSFAEEAITRAQRLLVTLNNAGAASASITRKPASPTATAAAMHSRKWSRTIFSTIREAQMYWAIGRAVALGAHSYSLDEALVHYNTGCRLLLASMQGQGQGEVPGEGQRQAETEASASIKCAVRAAVLDVAILHLGRGQQQTPPRPIKNDSLRSLLLALGHPTEAAGCGWDSSPEQLLAVAEGALSGASNVGSAVAVLHARGEGGTRHTPLSGATLHALEDATAAAAEEGGKGEGGMLLHPAAQPLVGLALLDADFHLT